MAGLIKHRWRWNPKGVEHHLTRSRDLADGMLFYDTVSVEATYCTSIPGILVTLPPVVGVSHQEGYTGLGHRGEFLPVSQHVI